MVIVVVKMVIVMETIESVMVTITIVQTVVVVVLAWVIDVARLPWAEMAADTDISWYYYVVWRGGDYGGDTSVRYIVGGCTTYNVRKDIGKSWAIIY